MNTRLEQADKKGREVLTKENSKLLVSTSGKGAQLFAFSIKEKVLENILIALN
jgi:hypothetical protein